jgi:hypothetical protein
MDCPFQFPKYFQCSDTDKIFFTLSMDLTGFSSAFFILIRSPTRIQYPVSPPGRVRGEGDDFSRLQRPV